VSPRKDPVEEKRSRLNDARESPGSQASLAILRKGLSDRVSIVVARAAELAGELGAAALVPDLIAGFDRFVAEPSRDKGCLAKTAISSPHRLEHPDPDVFSKGTPRADGASVGARRTRPPGFRAPPSVSCATIPALSYGRRARRQEKLEARCGSHALGRRALLLRQAAKGARAEVLPVFPLSWRSVPAGHRAVARFSTPATRRSRRPRRSRSESPATRRRSRS
jgi:hypothetical protein